MRPGKRLKLWKMKLTVSRLRAKSSDRDAAVMSRPPTDTLPDVGVSSAPMMFKQRRLAASRRAENHDELAVRYVQIHVVQRPDFDRAYLVVF